MPEHAPVAPNAPAESLRQPAGHRIVIAAETEILSAILHDNNVLRPLRGGDGLGAPALDWSQFGDPQLRVIARAMWELSDDRTPITVGTLAGRLGAERDPRLRSLLQRIDDAAVGITVDALPRNVLRVLEKANERLLRQIAQWGLAQLEERPRDAASIAAAVQEQLSAVRASRASLRDGSARAIIESGKHRTIARGTPIGLSGPDSLTYGLAAGEKLILSASPGGRKTTLAVFAATQLMRLRHLLDRETGERIPIPPEPVLFLQKDVTRDMLVNQFIAQIATARMRVLAAQELATARQIAMGDALDLLPADTWTISARGLPLKERSAPQHQAILYAEERLLDAPLEIRDGEDDVHRFEVQLSLIADAVMNRGAKVVIDDYIGASIMEGATSDKELAFTYKAKMTPVCSSLGAGYGMKLIGLSQRSNAVNAHGRTGDSAGLMGGGDLHQFASYILELGGDPDDASVMTATGVKVRYGQRGIRYVYRINPSSGLILNPGLMTPS